MSWAEVEAQFSDRPKGTIQRLASEWAPRMGVSVPDLGPHCRVELEHWSHIKIGEVLDKAAEDDPKMYTAKPPRWNRGPLTVFCREGRYGLIDGRHRANLWRHECGKYPVLVIYT